jgi:hypothetical protein
VAVSREQRPLRREPIGLRTVAGRILGAVCVTLVLAWLAAVALAVAIGAYKILLLITERPGRVVGGPVITWPAAFGLAGGVALASWVGVAGSRRDAPGGRAGILRIQAGTFLAGLLAISVLLIPDTAPQVSIGPGMPTRSLTVLPGTVVQLTNTSAAARLVLCTGANSRCQAARGAPARLTPPGLVVPPGQTADVTFPTVGTFHLISTATAGAAVTVVVRQGAGYDNGPDGCVMPMSC